MENCHFLNFLLIFVSEKTDIRYFSKSYILGGLGSILGRDIGD